jgi:hypothetical protein
VPEKAKPAAAETPPPQPAEPLKPPYLRLAESRGRFNVWLVDGAHIRARIDREFTNFGQHYRHSYIPELEFWIDQESKGDEQDFFIEHLLVEHRLMAKGMSYPDALAKAGAAERRERRRAGDLDKATRNGRTLPLPAATHERLWKKLDNGLGVWVVNGRLVRSIFDVDFTAGGHEHVYEYVPAGEVWIDNDVEEHERPYVLLHELHERNRMAGGWTYRKAHAESSRLEQRLRNRPDELHEALVAEGW